jgi:hypothetical protein
VRQKRHCVGVRKLSRGVVDGPPKPTISPPALQTYFTPRQHMADSAECWQNTISQVSSYHQGKPTYILQASTWVLCPPQPVSLLGHASSFRLAQVIFEPNLFLYKYPNNLISVILPAYTAYDDGTDRVF